MNVLVSGMNGFMGREVAKLAAENFKGAKLAFGVDPTGESVYGAPCFKSFDEANTCADVIVDFSHHSCTADLVAYAKKNNIPLVIATTGQTDEETNMIKNASLEIPVFFASNYSMGVALLVELAKKTAATFEGADIEIVETHHNRKIDAPSGTALTLAKEIANVTGGKIKSGRSGMEKREANEIGISSIRRGNIVGIHEILVTTPNESITLKHEAINRALFAEGALTAAAWLIKKPVGLYDMKSLVNC